MEVREIHGIAVDDAESADSGRGEVQRSRGSETPGPDDLSRACPSSPNPGRIVCL